MNGSHKTRAVNVDIDDAVNIGGMVRRSDLPQPAASSLDQRVVSMLMNMIRPTGTSDCHRARAGFAKLVRDAFGERMYELHQRESREAGVPEVSTAEDYESDAQRLYERISRADPYYLTPEFTDLHRILSPGFDLQLSELPWDSLSRPQVFFMAPGAELYLPDEEHPVVLFTFFFANAIDGIGGDEHVAWFLAFLADGAEMTVPFNMGPAGKALTAALWLVLQPELATVEVVDHTVKPSRAERRAGKKATARKVHVVKLRHTVATGVANVAEAEKHEHAHRWIVRGHWRNQRVGVGRKEIRRLFVAPYVKGPDGAPLLDRVYRW